MLLIPSGVGSGALAIRKDAGSMSASESPKILLKSITKALLAFLRSHERPFRVCSAAGDVDSSRAVCVVGGGPSGLAVCRTLCDAKLPVVLIQESRGLGGKLCTKFVKGKEDPRLHFDMGVQLLRPLGRFAEELQGVVKPWPLPGRFKCITCKGDWNKWCIEKSEDLPVDGLVVGIPSMSAIGRHLASKCEGLEVHVDRTAQVQGRQRKTGKWSVMWSRAEANVGQIRYRPELAEGKSEASYRNFDAVVLAFEANKILQGAKLFPSRSVSLFSSYSNIT